MTDTNADQTVREEAPSVAFSEFLEAIPPGSLTNVLDVAKPTYYTGGGISGYRLATPEIQLHCEADSCNGLRFFRTSATTESIPDDSWAFTYVKYVCSNCRKTEKTFSLAARREPGDIKGRAYKFGELPDYGPPTPARLIRLIGPDRELFLKGRRCENQGLGIGAFVYYRRVVENQKARILDEIIKVSEKLNAPAATIELLRSARGEVQFSKAIESVKDAIPQALLINGHNPLTLLHSALSDGLHDRNDERCLALANSIRVVLGELSDRLSQALKDEAELTRALTQLFKHKDG